MRNSNTNRRKLLLGLGSGIAGVAQLPEKWTKPVIDSVILPAHAQTSGTTSIPTTTPLAPCDLTIPSIQTAPLARVNGASYSLDSGQCLFTEDGSDVIISVHVVSGPVASVTLGTNPQITLQIMPTFPPVFSTDSQSYVEQFISADGARWQASFSMDVLDPGFGFGRASVSEIILSRLSV